MGKIAGCLDLSNRLSREALSSRCGKMLPGAPCRVALHGVAAAASEVLLASEDSGRLLAYDGEIYNRDELAKRHGLGPLRADHEGEKDALLLESLLEKRALRDVLNDLSGAFSIALWERRGLLALAIDRVGLKGLYYGHADGCFFFASDLSSIRAHPSFSQELDLSALGVYFRHNYIPAPHSVYKSVKKMVPGSVLRVSTEGGGRTEVERIWNPAKVFDMVVSNRFDGTLSDAVDELDRLLTASVEARFRRAPEPGIFLSGGVDSSLLAAIAAKVAGRAVRTFAIGFEEAAYDEAPYAAQVARHIGTDHAELRVTPGMAMEVLPRIPEIYAEPFADSSQIPTTLLCLFAAKDVGAVLTGDGGDEIFGGYRNYRIVAGIDEKLAGLPAPVRSASAGVLSFLARAGWMGKKNSRRAVKLSQLLEIREPELLHRCITSLSYENEDILPASEADTVFTDRTRWPEGGTLMERLMFLDFCMYLPDDGVVKIRSALVHAGLAGRSPISVPEVVAFAWRLPLEYKIDGEIGKRVLKELLYRYVPKDLVDRPKKGFAMPLSRWLGDRFAPWADALWEGAAKRVDGLFGAGYHQRLRAHYEKSNNESRWGILQLLQWLERWR